MPIVIGQPQPVSTAVSSGYGAAEQYNKDRDYFLRAQQAAAQQNLAQAQFAASLMPSERDIFQTISQQAMAGFQAQHQNELASFEAANRQRDMQLRFQLQSQLNQDELSQSEELRLSRMKQAASAIQDQIDSGYLSQDEGADAMMKLKSGIDPMVQRQSRAKIQMEQAEMQKIQQQTEFQSKLLAQQEKFRSMSAQDRVEGIDLPDGQKLYGYTDPSGNFHIFQPKSPADERHPEYGITTQDYMKAYHEEEIQARRIAEGERNAKTQNTETLAMEPAHPEMQKSEGFDNRVQQLLSRGMQNRGLPPLTEFRQGMRKGGDYGVGSDIQWKEPWDINNPATEEQKQMVGDMKQSVSAIDSLLARGKADGAERTDVYKHLNAASEELTKYKSLRDMPPDVRADFEGHMRAIAAILKTANARPSRSQAPENAVQPNPYDTGNYRSMYSP